MITVAAHKRQRSFSEYSIGGHQLVTDSLSDMVSLDMHVLVGLMVWLALVDALGNQEV